MGAYVLAVEDKLSEAIAKKIVSHVAPNAEFLFTLSKGGNGYLQSKMQEFINMCKIYSVVMVTDLDNRPCPYSLLSDWLGAKKLRAIFSSG